MPAKWIKNNKQNLKPEVIFEKLDELKKVNSEGKVSFSDFEFMNAGAVLESMVDFPKAADYLDKSSLISSSMWATIKSTQSSKDEFLNFVNQKIAEASSKPLTTFYILTSISTQKFAKGMHRVNILGSTITFYKRSYPRKFKGRKELIAKTDKVEDSITDLYSKVVIEVKSKSSYEAARHALKALDLYRALLCFHTNNMGHILGSKWRPANKVRLGNIHTVHGIDGAPVDERLWYETNFVPQNPFSTTSENEQTITKNISWYLSKLDILDRKYRNVLIDSMLRVVQALDETDPDVSITRAWSALETLVAHEESNCDNVSKRISFLFSDSDYQAQVIEQIRQYRNSNVHTGLGSSESPKRVFLLHKYFFRTILFHFKQAGNFQNLYQANAFLDLPKDVEQLDKDIELLKKAREFRLG